MRLIKNLKLKKLDTAGIGHHALIALLVISTIAGLGAWRVWNSSAAVVYRTSPMSAATAEGCDLVGRKWLDNKCSTTCIKAGDAFIAGKAGTEFPSGYCPGAVNQLNQAECTKTGRRFVNNTGCTRQLNQAEGKYANSKHCIDSSASYTIPGNMCACPTVGTRDANTGRCAIPPTNTQPSTTTGGSTTTTATKLDKVMCTALGRVYSDNNATCTQACLTGAGNSITHQNGTRYCDKAVLTNATEARCKEVNRRWTPAGCARRADQQDKSPDGFACLPGFPYYNARLAAQGGSGLDVCEKDAATAAVNEKAGFSGIRNGLPVCDDAKKVLAADKKSCITPVAGSSTGSGTSGNGSTQNQGGSTTNPGTTTTTQDGKVTIDGEYRVVLYKDRDFKGDQLIAVATVKDGKVTYRVSEKKGTADAKALNPQPKTLSAMPSGWNDAVSSFRVVSGRWKLCPDKDYKASSSYNCISPFASDPNMNDTSNDKRKLDNKVSSLRPIVETELAGVALLDEAGKPVLTESGDTVFVQPTCPADASGNVPAAQDGKCPDGKEPATCPTGLVFKDDGCKEKVYSANTIIGVDKSIGQRNCELLGREYIGKPVGGKTTNGGQYGCSLYTCEKERDGAPRYSGDEKNAVCISYQFDAAYAVPLAKETCDKLHRIYIEQVQRCAQEPNRKDKDQTIVKSDRCKNGNYTTYYIFKANQKDDECFKPNYFQKARSAAKSVGGGLDSALKQGPRAFCNTVKRGNYHWNGKKCVRDRNDDSGLPGEAGLKGSTPAQDVACSAMYSSNVDKYCVPRDKCKAGKYATGYLMNYNGKNYKVDHVCFELSAGAGDTIVRGEKIIKSFNYTYELSVLRDECKQNHANASFSSHNTPFDTKHTKVTWECRWWD